MSKFQFKIFQLLLSAFLRNPMPEDIALNSMEDSIPAQDWIGMNAKPEFHDIPTITILEVCYFMSEAVLNDGSDVNFKELSKQLKVSYDKLRPLALGRHPNRPFC